MDPSCSNPFVTPAPKRSPLQRRVTVGALVCALAVALGGFVACGDGDDDGGRSPEEIAEEGYLLGFPLVVTERTLATFGAAIGVNRPFTQQALSNASTRVVVAPNTDTLYAIAVLDLRAGPLLLTLPDIPDRYHTFQFMDAFTNSFFYLGTRSTGGAGGTWLLRPSDWQGEAPAGVEIIDVPTAQAFLLGRVLVDGPEDVAAVTALTSAVRIEALDPEAVLPPLAPAAGMPAATGSNGIAFWDELGDALAINTPISDAQRRLVAQLADLGVGPGRHPSTEIVDPETRAVLEAGVARGNQRLAAAAANTNGDGAWRYRTDIGTYGDDLFLRALVARVGWGANVTEEAVYMTASTTGDGEELRGATGYRIRFEPGQEPPVDAFWSLTLYGPDRFFVDNDLQRFALSDRSPGLDTEDGAVEIVVAADAPAGEEDRWLPAPPGPFNLMLRLYLPRPAVIDGTWRPPAITPLD